MLVFYNNGFKTQMLTSRLFVCSLRFVKGSLGSSITLRLFPPYKNDQFATIHMEGTCSVWGTCLCQCWVATAQLLASAQLWSWVPNPHPQSCCCSSLENELPQNTLHLLHGHRRPFLLVFKEKRYSSLLSLLNSQASKASLQESLIVALAAHPAILVPFIFLWRETGFI